MPSRLMIYPYTALIILSSIGFEKIFLVFPKKSNVYFKTSVLILLLITLMKHSYEWSIAKSELNYTLSVYENRYDYLPKVFNIKDDYHYINIVNKSYLLSLITFIFIILCLWSINKKLKYNENRKMY